MRRVANPNLEIMEIAAIRLGALAEDRKLWNKSGTAINL